jgi:hypothetical protein
LASLTQTLVPPESGAQHPEGQSDADVQGWSHSEVVEPREPTISEQIPGAGQAVPSHSHWPSLQVDVESQHSVPHVVWLGVHEAVPPLLLARALPAGACTVHGVDVAGEQVSSQNCCCEPVPLFRSRVPVHVVPVLPMPERASAHVETSSV